MTSESGEEVYHDLDDEFTKEMEKRRKELKVPSDQKLGENISNNIFEDTITDSSFDDLEEEVSVRSGKIPTYWDKCIAYWKQYIDPNVWRSMPVCLLIGFAFWCLGFIPNFEKCMLSQSIFAIIGGVLLGAIPKVQEFIHRKTIHPGIAFSKGTFMQLAVILYGFRVKLSDIAEVGWGGAITSILMVAITFLVGCLLGSLLKVPLTQGGIVSCGFSICGIAAILSTCQLFESSGAEVSLACVFVIVGGFLDIAIYPSLYSIRDKLGFDDKTFGITAGASIKEIAHTVSVGLSCSAGVSKYAMIVKMFKVFCMPFMLIVLGFALPIYRKAQEKKTNATKAGHDAQKSTYEKCTEFWGKVTIPYFAFLFILFTIVNTYTNISEKAHDIFSEIIIIFLSASMFCVGITTNLRELIHGTSWRPLVHVAILYIWVFGLSWFLTYIFTKIGV
ncbi:hypothetical protein M9Y10_046102 [Tritrichomonas musculus]|uniref:Sulfate exporter family transporter n=1 Tax=Tritrichomonas musculus TaxID=1915356 RepID=A0ABR2JX61_9EUKA